MASPKDTSAKSGPLPRPRRGAAGRSSGKRRVGVDAEIARIGGSNGDQVHVIRESPQPWTGGNRLLAALPLQELETLRPSLVSVALESGQVLYRSGEEIAFVFFPDNAVASLLSRMENDAVVEVGTVGNESVIGLGLALGSAVSLPETIIQVPGCARRMAAADFVEALRHLPMLRQLVARCTSAFITQVSQTAACNRLHGIEQRCARWLLLTHDRMGGDNDVPLTHKFLSYMLGVRRAGVTEALGMLAVDGLIHSGNGRITIVDRMGLEAASCECYAIVRAHAVEPFAVPSSPAA